MIAMTSTYTTLLGESSSSPSPPLAASAPTSVVAVLTEGFVGTGFACVSGVVEGLGVASAVSSVDDPVAAASIGVVTAGEAVVTCTAWYAVVLVGTSATAVLVVSSVAVIVVVALLAM